MKNKVLSFCDSLSAYADAHCKCEYQISVSYGDNFSCNVLEGEIDRYSVDDYISVVFKVKLNGKLGHSTTTALDPDGIPALVTAAMENASIIENPDEQFIFKGSEKYITPKVYSEKISKLTAKDKIDFAKKLETEAKKADNRVIRVQSCTVTTGEDTKIIKNSHGLQLCETSGFAAAYVIPVVKIGEEMNNGFGFCAGFDGDAFNADEAVGRAVKEAIDFCGAKPVKSGSYRLIFRNSAFSDMAETFCSIFSAEAAQRGLSMLAGKEGESIASECVTVYDDATVDFGFGSHSFDSEGVAGQRTAVIENGVLKSLLYNLKTAKKSGVSSTGNAGISPSNFIFTPGDLSLDGLTREMDSGIMVTEVSGLHAGANASTGDFSLPIKGYLVENGEIKRPISGVTVSGNYYTMLKNISKLGSDVYKNPFGVAVVTPSALLDKPMSVAGD